MNGILSLHKPAGPTSFDMVRLVRRLTGLRRVGHGGTLDPAASGVLPVLLGQATRVSEYLHSATKTYRARVRLGIATDTYDAEGQVVATADPSGVALGQAREALECLRGQTWQTPPMHSALKRQGRPLYRLARAGIEVDREPRRVRIDAITLLAWEPPSLTIEVVCGRGTYIRSLAHDLGQALGCGAHLGSLVRTRVGPFTIEDALTVEALFDAVHGGALPERLYALDWAMLHLPAAVLAPAETRALRHGQTLAADPSSPALAAGTPCRAYGFDGALVGLMTLDASEGRWRPAKVFSPEDEQAGDGSVEPAPPDEQEPDPGESLTGLIP